MQSNPDKFIVNPDLFKDDAERVRMGFTVTPLGLPNMFLFDEKGKPLAGLQMPKDDSPSLMLRDKRGQHYLALKVTEEGEPHMVVRDKAGKAVAGLMMSRR